MNEFEDIRFHGNIIQVEGIINALEPACRNGDMVQVKNLISRGVNEWGIGLTSACAGGHLEIAKLMISHGANNWHTALAYACEGGNQQIIDLLISRGQIFGILDWFLHVETDVWKS